MKHFIWELNNLCISNKIKHLRVVACCCGHGVYPMTIIMENNTLGSHGKSKLYFDLVSGMEIPRKRNFYKKDKQGYYYIPELKLKK
jgi:hypothetical protein